MSALTRAEVMRWWPRGPLARRRSVLALLDSRDELIAACTALDFFADHLGGCSMIDGRAGSTCDCGLDDAVTGALSARAKAMGK